MNKLLLLILTITLTFTLTGCRSTEDKIQDLFNNFSTLINDTAAGEDVNVEHICNNTFTESDALNCAVDYSVENIDPDDLPYLFDAKFRVLTVEVIEDSNFNYEEVYLVTIESTIKYQETATSELDIHTEEVDVYVVKEDGELRIMISNPVD